MPEEKKQRNLNIYKDWKDGMSGVRLVAKYRISSAAIYAKVRRYKELEDQGKLVVDNNGNYRYTDN